MECAAEMIRSSLLCLSVLCAVTLVNSMPALAQTAAGLPPHAVTTSPMVARQTLLSSIQLAQAQRSDTTLPIDLTPVRLPERGAAFGGFQGAALYHLPAKMFFNANVENSLRLETNVFQTERRQRQDMIYRVLPNVTLGYALTPKTRVATNYFFLRDQYTKYNNQLSRNIHSIGFRIDHDIQLSEKTTLTPGFFARELFITNSDELNDLLPQALLTHRVGDRGILYSSVIGQIRFRNLLGRYQEFDQFYTVGGVWRSRPWTYVADATFITNFGKKALRGAGNNQNIILTLEAGRQIHPKLPLTAFVRCEPIFNIGSSTTTGFAGFNFRVFGGIRAEVSKPALFPVKFGSGA
jgi:hypothetical protein